VQVAEEEEEPELVLPTQEPLQTSKRSLLFLLCLRDILCTPKAHIHMNSIYSDAFMPVDVGDLFAMTDPPTRVTLVADPVVFIKAKI